MPCLSKREKGWVEGRWWKRAAYGVQRRGAKCQAVGCVGWCGGGVCKACVQAKVCMQKVHTVNGRSSCLRREEKDGEGGRQKREREGQAEEITHEAQEVEG